jgi:AraC family transcriptional regulator of adaptative response / DNA-3-methyladenine glycosylase II
VDFDACYRAMRSRDTRFDGVFFVGVTSTGIYCRPSCPAMTPKREHITLHRTAAGAQQAGFRACKRCRPDAVSGSPEWNVRADVVGRAMRLIADGVVDREGVAGLAARLGYSARHLTRQLTEELGAGPLALARAQRAQTARILLETTDLPVSAVAFAAGFSSVRQCNDTVRAVFALTPTALRRAAKPGGTPATPGVIALRLPFRAPFDWERALAFFTRRSVAGMEEVDGETYRRAVPLPHGAGVLELSAANGSAGWIDCRLHLEDLRDLSAAVQRARRLLDLDADSAAVDAALGTDEVLAPLVAARPGLRVPGAVDGDELAVRVVLGQQVSVAGAVTLAARLTARYGKPLASPVGGVTHLFPTAAALAEADDADFAMPESRRRGLRGLCRALADGDLRLDGGADRDEVGAQLLAMPGIGPWTVAAIRMRALADPDVFLPTDLGVRYALRRLGQAEDPKAATALAERWRPWRSYALQHLWALLNEGDGA